MFRHNNQRKTGGKNNLFFKNKVSLQYNITGQVFLLNKQSFTSFLTISYLFGTILLNLRMANEQFMTFDYNYSKCQNVLFINKSERIKTRNKTRKIKTYICK